MCFSLKRFINDIFRFLNYRALTISILLTALTNINVIKNISGQSQVPKPVFHLLCLSIWFLFVSNSRQNGWTDRAQILCGTLHDPIKGLWMLRITKMCLKILDNKSTNSLLLFYIVKRVNAPSIEPQLKVEISDVC